MRWENKNIRKTRHEQITEKSSRKYVFRYDSGLEHEVMAHLLDMIFDEGVDFDWSDATLISFGLIEDLVKERELFQNYR